MNAATSTAAAWIGESRAVHIAKISAALCTILYRITGRYLMRMLVTYAILMLSMLLYLKYLEQNSSFGFIVAAGQLLEACKAQSRCHGACKAQSLLSFML
ncbi:hypothetical protein M011DRAFT_191061 [Sporormia fimetaria CBS 119925]|uniref:Uncharacterized protein n=1 Tax=Sporormia fimetaria CBS 119925 TaxID=1340428 RepID=A0A6A6VP63_9PLEO|nr:hypothetical protein M011DRAFT_191061 [Sporormia fimetaria CBS 119925]